MPEPEPVLPSRPVRSIRREDACAWLREHGFDPSYVTSASIRIEHHLRDGVGVWLDVERFLLTASGQLYPVPGGDRAASAAATVPLRSWPPLDTVQPPSDG